MPRPRKYGGELKTDVVKLRLTPFAHEWFDRIADDYGCSKADVIERLARGEFRIVYKDK